MRVSLVGLIVAMLTFGGIITFCPSSFGQSLAFKGRVKKIDRPGPKAGQVSIIDWLEKLEENNNVSFAYQKQNLSGKYIDPSPLLTDSLEDYVRDILSGAGLGIRKVKNIQENIFVIFPISDSGGNADSNNLATFSSLNGRVRNVTGSPLQGVNIVVKGRNIGGTTNVKGDYALYGEFNTNDTLVFSYVGLSRLEAPVLTNQPVNVMLRENLQPLTEIIVTALGIDRKQRSVGYSTATLHAADLNGVGNTNIVSTMYGKVPGMRIRTAPGGATSAVSVQIRGFNSLNYNSQPLFVIDGIPMRDANEKGQAGLNNDDYYTDTRIRGNGILDISPEDIETMTVLKGASATALYGSDAGGGVVLINTKKGVKKKGVGVTINYTATREKAAFTPKFQNSYGPGFSRARNIAMGADADGWVQVDNNNDGVHDSRRPLFESNAQFGPALQGQQVQWWDGTTKSYEAQPNNYKNLHRDGYNSIFNIALSDKADKLSYRLSYTNNTYEGIQVGGKLNRNTFNLNMSYKFSDRLSADVVTYFSNSFVHNRPMKLYRLASSWSGFYSRAENMTNFFDKYQTSEGYKWVPYDQSQRNPEEALKYTTPKGYDVMDLLWQQLKNSENEKSNRLISSVTLNYKLHKDLSLRGRFGTDLTRQSMETKQHNEYPTAFNGTTSTGSYGQAHGNYSFMFAEALATYSKKISRNFNFTANGGFQIRNEQYKDVSTSTNGGLVLENWFDFKNSFFPSLTVRQTTSSILKYAFLGIADFSYKDIFYLQATGRQESSSTLPPGNNSYFYPSVNSGFIFSEAFKLPSFINYGKLRTSYGVVGNAPPPYEANVLYELTTLQTVKGPVTSAGTNGNLYGNNRIKPELRHELEIGTEIWMINNRIGIDLTYYQSRTKDQILKLDLPASVGASRILTNVGVLRSRGWELALKGVPVTGRFSWTTTFNAAVNSTTLNHLVKGIDQLVFRDLEGGSVQIVAEPGQRIGNIYSHPRLTDSQNNPVIQDDGMYVIDKSKYVRTGNILPRATGGLGNSLSYKNLSFHLQMDYSIGGQIVSPSLKYGKGSGLYKNTLQYRDEAHGGLAYYVNDAGENTLVNGQVPAGKTIYHDGLILPGVNGEGRPNSTIIDAASYYLNTFDWGNNAWNDNGMIYNNTYLKVREIALIYSIPQTVVSRLHMNQIQLSLIARNVFYVYRTLENLDPETTIGSSWLNQGIDEGSEAATRSYGFSIRMGF
ncbi:MAG: SusC/RagA family TonB-linked outer membrane protein [Chryseolinea sp.]